MIFFSLPQLNTIVQTAITPGLHWLWLFLTLIYGSLATLSFLRQAFVQRVSRSLSLYLLCATGWAITQTIFLWPNFPLNANHQLIAILGTIGLTIIFVLLSRSFLQRQLLSIYWGIASGFLLLVFAILYPDFTPIPAIWLGQEGSLAITKDGVALLFAYIAWLLQLTSSAVITYYAYQATSQRPLHRNRLAYWALIIGITLLAGTFIFFNQLFLGTLFHLLITLLITYAMLVHDLYDLRQISRQVLTIFLIAVVTGLLFIGTTYLNTYLWLQITNTPPSSFETMMAGTITAIILVLVFQRLADFIHLNVQRLTAASTYDAGAIVREYSVHISNIVDMDDLESLAIQLISKGMEVRHGTIYLVDYIESDLVGRGAYSWKSMQGYTQYPLELGILPEYSPVAQYLSSERRPLTHFDIDMQSQFQEAIGSEEHHWLSALGIEVYVPIHAADEWVGLMALGPKVSGDRYYDNDLEVLSTLADQTAVALQNARLVADLRRHAHEVETANAELEVVTRKLQEMDQLKSDFIGVITHELRTPFSHIAFSVQILEKYGTEQLIPEQKEELNQLTKHVQNARKMIDGLVTFAAFIRKQGELNLTWFQFAPVLEEVLKPLKPLAKTKQVELFVQLSPQIEDVEADKERLMDAIHHLVHNAIKFTDNGGVIQIRCWPQDDMFTFEVKDTGVGIPEEKMDSLWDGFSQMADPLRRGQEGLGLGLTLVKFVIQAHEGKVWVNSTEGHGSTFGFEIPL
ncbi:MAG TPA: ATP-binding protein [Anaerolineae bacterium]|nr:ATP-binding protein [Anaerolineae bacterium]